MTNFMKKECGRDWSSHSTFIESNDTFFLKIDNSLIWGKIRRQFIFIVLKKKIRNYVNVLLFIFVFISLIDHVNVNCFEVD